MNSLAKVTLHINDLLPPASQAVTIADELLYQTRKNVLENIIIFLMRELCL